MSRLRSKWILIGDTLRPVYLSIFTFIIARFFFDLQWPSKSAEMLSAALTVSSVIIGFLISAKAIIISSSGRGIERLREMDLMVELVDAFATAIYIAMIFCLVCVAGFFMTIERPYEAVWAGVGVGMIYSFIKITRLLFKIVGKN